jgi:trk system potassium uptake protein TrkH
MGITSSFSPVSQLVLVATMYVGRVGILLLMAAILGETKLRVVQYPEENLLV